MVVDALSARDRVGTQFPHLLDPVAARKASSIAIHRLGRNEYLFGNGSRVSAGGRSRLGSIQAEHKNPYVMHYRNRIGWFSGIPTFSHRWLLWQSNASFHMELDTERGIGNEELFGIEPPVISAIEQHG